MDRDRDRDMNMSNWRLDSQRDMQTNLTITSSVPLPQTMVYIEMLLGSFG